MALWALPAIWTAEEGCRCGRRRGCAIAYPIAKKLHELGCEVHSIVGFRNKDLVILEDEFAACSDKLVMMTDDAATARRRGYRSAGRADQKR